MTALCLADAGEAADLAAFLARLIHYDRAAAVRLQAGGGVLAVFGRPASFEVLAIRTARLAAGAAPREAGASAALDVTVSAGQLADAIDAAGAAQSAGSAPAASGVETAASGLVVTLPAPVTGPAWAGLLPPRGGWQRIGGLPDAEAMRGAVAASVAEFRSRIEALPEGRRTRPELDRVGREIWSRTLGDTELPLRAVHAAQSLGFLRPVPAGASASAGPRVAGVLGPGAAATATLPEPVALLAAGAWLRLRTPYGSIAVRKSGLPGLMVTPA